MDFDEIGQMNIENFSQKIGQNKCYIVKKPSNNLKEPNQINFENIKDANDALKQDPQLIRDLIRLAKPIPSENIVKF